MGNSSQGTNGTIAVADTSHVAHEHVTSIQLPPAAVVAYIYPRRGQVCNCTKQYITLLFILYAMFAIVLMSRMMSSVFPL
jgi:hypothetical protein